MNNIDSVLISPKAANNTSGDKKNTASENAVKNFYQTLMDSAAKKTQEAEIKRKKRLAHIIQKLLAGIILTGDELQFLKNNAPMYYHQAMRQQRSYMTKNAGQDSIGKIEPITSKILL